MGKYVALVVFDDGFDWEFLSGTNVDDAVAEVFEKIYRDGTEVIKVVEVVSITDVDVSAMEERKELARLLKKYGNPNG